MKVSIRLILGLVCLGITVSSFGQDEDMYYVPNYIPPSPTAANLGKYADIPVNHYNGIPQISIPLWEVKTRDLSLPISLSYHASGVKVDEISSWVGMGWSVIANGVINRTIIGRDDGDVWGYIGASWLNVIFGDNYDCQEGIVWEDLGWAMEGKRDLQPDIYTFNFNGYTGKFVFDIDGNIHIIPKMDLKIELNPFVITTPDGIKYYFEQEEFTDSENRVYTNESSTQVQSEYGVITSWYLTKIESLNGDIITFEYYVPYKQKTKNLVSETQYDYFNPVISCWGDPYCSPSFANVYQRRIRDIVDLRYIKNNGSIMVEFIRSPYRCDLAQAFRLSELRIFDYDGDILKSYLFNQSYSIGNPNNCPECPGLDISSDEYFDEVVDTRMWLHNLTEVGSDGSEKPPYQFLYYFGSLPNRYSSAIDYWGYSNGRTQNQTRIPEYTESGGTYYEGANLEPNFSKAIVGTLQKIIYPTGGKSEFVFESNDYNNFPGSEYETFEKEKHYEFSDEFPWVTEQTSDFVVSSNTVFHLQYKCDNGVVGNYDPTYFHVKLIAPDSTIINDFLVTDDPDEYVTEVVDQIEPGTYSVVLYASQSYSTDAYPEMHIYWTETTTTQILNKKGGGIRIKKMSHNDNLNTDNDQVLVYDYCQVNQNDELISTGKLMNELVPCLYGINAKACVTNLGNGFFTVEQSDCAAIKRSTQTLISQSSSAQGGFVGYDKVTEYYSSFGNNGKTEYYYSNNVDQNPISLENDYFADIPSNDFTYKNGLLEKSYYYKEKLEVMGGFQYCYLSSEYNSISKSFHNDTQETVKYKLSLWHYGPGINITCSVGSCIVNDNLETNNHGLKYCEADIELSNPGEIIITIQVSAPGEMLDDIRFECVEGNCSAYPNPELVEGFTDFESFSNEYWNYSEEQLKTYVDIDDNFQRVRSIENEYETINTENVKGLVAAGYLDGWAYRTQSNYFHNPPAPYSCNVDRYINKHISEWTRIKRIHEEEFDYYSGDLTLSKTTFFEYNDDEDHFNPIKRRIINSDGNESITELFYPGDYNLDGGLSDPFALYIKSMQNEKHMHNSLVEKVESVIEQGSQSKKITSGSLYKYKSFNNKILPCEIWKFNTSIAIDENDFTYSNISNGGFIIDDNYFLDKTFDKYDENNGRLLQFTPHNDMTTSYLWGYDGLYLIAEILNATHEDNISFDITTGVRVCPDDALMTTYTYYPLKGLKSITDPKGISVFYEYDNFGRLKLTRDNNGDILKRYLYNYKSEE